MNTQPKFKEGDRVRVVYKESTLHNEIGTVEEVSEDGVIIVLSNGQRIWLVSKFLTLLESHTPDMLAIPDDHVWPDTNNQQ